MTSGARGREAAASAAQYVLLGGFASVATGISAQGLTGFARDNMGLHGAWPYLLFLALDGAAGVCAVLLTRRAARAESGLAPRLAVWGLVAASASFNFTHAPRRPAAPEAFGLMPVIAAILFEFTLRELQLRAGRADRRLAALRWLHPAERVRVQLRLAADDHISAEAATRRVRIDLAARRLYQLRRALLAQGRAARPGGMAARRARLAEHRAHAALIRAGFDDQAIAAQVLRQVQVLTRTRDLARLDYTTAGAAQAAIASLITSGAPVTPPGPPVMPAGSATPGGLQDGTSRSPASGINGTAAGQVSRTGQPGPALPPPAPAADRQPASGGPAASGEAAASQPRSRTASSWQMPSASSPTRGSTASGSARRRSATGSAATATVSPTTPCGRCWPRPPASPQAASRRETRDAPAPARPGSRPRGGPPAHARRAARPPAR